MKKKLSFRKNRISSKAGVCLMAALASISMVGCGSASKEEETVVSISKEGTVSESIVESFDKSYYDEEELKQTILSEVAAYNREMQTGNITVEKIEVKDSMATVEMTYASVADYEGFQGGVFFLGTAQEAQDAGYDLNTVLSGTQNELETIGMSDMLAMTDYQILITDKKETVELNGKAAYVSDNVTVSKNLKTVTVAEEIEQLAYVMYR